MAGSISLPQCRAAWLARRYCQCRGPTSHLLERFGDVSDDGRAGQDHDCDDRNPNERRHGVTARSHGMRWLSTERNVTSGQPGLAR
jgi:hypothetical protein